MLCYYGCSVALDVNNNITYNSESSVLLHVICKKKKKNKLCVMNLCGIIMILKLI
jgi:hypothetical protein